MIDEIHHDLDRVLEMYFRARITPMIWVASATVRHVGLLERALWTVSQTSGARALTLEELHLRGAGDDVRVIAMFGQRLRSFRFREPPLPQFGIVVMAPEPPDSRALINDAFRVAADTGDLRVIRAYEWEQLAGAAERGDLRPLGTDDTHTTQWLALRPVYNCGPETLIYWGLCDRTRSPGAALRMHQYVVTNTDGKPVAMTHGSGMPVVTPSAAISVPRTTTNSPPAPATG